MGRVGRVRERESSGRSNCRERVGKVVGQEKRGWGVGSMWTMIMSREHEPARLPRLSLREVRGKATLSVSIETGHTLLAVYFLRFCVSRVCMSLETSAERVKLGMPRDEN